MLTLVLAKKWAFIKSIMFLSPESYMWHVTAHRHTEFRGVLRLYYLYDTFMNGELVKWRRGFNWARQLLPWPATFLISLYYNRCAVCCAWVRRAWLFINKSHCFQWHLLPGKQACKLWWIVFCLSISSWPAVHLPSWAVFVADLNTRARYT